MSDDKLTKGQKAYLTRVVNEFKNEANSVLGEIRKLKKDLISGQEGDLSLIEQFADAETKIDGYKKSIKKLHNQIFVSEIPGQKSLSQSISDFTDEFKKQKKEITSIKGEIDTYRKELFGHENDKGENVDGLKHKIDLQINQLKELHDTNKEKQVALFDEIEKLLKGASTVALAKAFKDHKDSFRIVNFIWMGLFIASIISVMVLSVVIFQKANFEIQDMWKGTVGNLPFIGGAIWIAIYASKQRSQNKRLQQEYAFKEDVAKIYYGLKKEIEEIDDTDFGKELKQKVMKIMVEVVSANPSETLDSNSHNDNGPVLESLNKLTSLVKREK